MDLLDRVAAPVAELLDDVDALLVTHGAPAGHPVWLLLRRVGLLSSDVLAQVVALSPDGIRSIVGPLETLAGDCQSAIATAPVELVSQGVAAEGYAARWAASIHQIAGDGDDGLAGRLSETANYLDQLADWAEKSRLALARELGACLGSAEAVKVRAGRGASGTPDTDAITAAADIAAHVLDAASRAIEDGWHLRQGWSRLQAEVPVRATPVEIAVPRHIDIR